MNERYPHMLWFPLQTIQGLKDWQSFSILNWGLDESLATPGIKLSMFASPSSQLKLESQGGAGRGLMPIRIDTQKYKVKATSDSEEVAIPNCQDRRRTFKTTNKSCQLKVSKLLKNHEICSVWKSHWSWCCALKPSLLEIGVLMRWLLSPSVKFMLNVQHKVHVTCTN